MLAGPSLHKKKTKRKRKRKQKQQHEERDQSRRMPKVVGTADWQ